MDRSKLMIRYFVLQTIKWLGFNFSFCLTFRDFWKKSRLHYPKQNFLRKSNTHVSPNLPTYSATYQPTTYFLQKKNQSYTQLPTIPTYNPNNQSTQYFLPTKKIPSSEKWKLWLIFLSYWILWIIFGLGKHTNFLVSSKSN